MVREASAMRKLDEILEQTKRLSAHDRRLLIEELEREPPAEEAGASEAAWLNAMDAFLALGGTGHSDDSDVSGDKYRHLADIYADKHE